MIDDDTLKANMAVNLRRLLAERRWTQRDLARRVEETDMEISRIVRGQYLPNAGTLARIAEALSTSTDYLLNAHPEISSQAG